MISAWSVRIVFWNCNENGLAKKLRNFDVTPQPIYKIQVLFPDRGHVVIVSRHAELFKVITKLSLNQTNWNSVC